MEKKLEMKAKQFFGLMAATLFLLSCSQNKQELQFDNPLPVEFGDPYIFKNNDVYYMMYSANFYGGEHYAVGYATSDHPLGPFTKAHNNPVLEKNTEHGGIVTGTGHNSITWSPNGKGMLCVYHGYTSETGENRVVFIDHMEVLDDGTLVVYGPTTSE